MSDDENDEQHLTANIRSLLKIVRDPSKTAYDLLPNGEMIGAFANKHAVESHIRKKQMKCEKAREVRKRVQSETGPKARKKAKHS